LHQTNSTDHAADLDASPGAAIVFGASGGIGMALSQALEAQGSFTRVFRFSRSNSPGLDLTDETTIATAARQVRDSGLTPRLMIDATGVLQGDGCIAEKSWNQIDMAGMLRAFAINAVGPALLIKHFLPLMPTHGRSVFVTLSARVGSIGDNRLGGWYSYRASKAALNQIVRTAAVELHRKRPEAICVALHPGTVDTALSAPFQKSGLQVRAPAVATQELLSVIDRLQPSDSGGLFDQHGEAIPW
jgi:NAD(P)-dependent dehydrogenase (short-subunit alcohol dehydrogenase family)